MAGGGVIIRSVYFLGESYELVRILVKDSPPGVFLDKNRLFVTVRENCDTYLQQVLERWYRQRAREIFNERALCLSREMGVTYNRIAIRNQKTRWGSCSCLKNLNFNWRLIMASPQVIDYLVVHELAHIKEMNHSRRFWQLVEMHCPEYRTHRRWLKERGSTLSLRHLSGSTSAHPSAGNRWPGPCL